MGTQSHDLTIIATFYGKRSESGKSGFDTRLIKALCSHFDLTPNGDDDWMDKKQRIFLRQFAPSTTPDTSIVQLAIGDNGNIKTIFSSIIKELEEGVANYDWNSMWGYSLIFLVQPSGRWNEKVADKLFQETVSVTKKLYGVTGNTDLVHADYPGGKLWLVDIPLKGDGKEASNIYTAICPKNDTKDFIVNHLYGPGASLLMPDLIAHKSYYEIRQYRMDEQKATFDSTIETMVNTSGAVLTSLTSRRVQIHTKELADSYAPLIAANAYLNRLRISIERQLINFNQWFEYSPQNSIFAFHRNYIEVAGLELDLMIKEADEALKSCQTTVGMIQTEIEKNRDNRQRRFENLLAIFGAILALGQIFNRDLTAELMPYFIPVPQNGYSILAIELVKAGFGIGVSLVIGIIIYSLLRIKK